MISSYKVEFLNSLPEYDVYTYLNSVDDNCLKKIAADPDVFPFMMNAALQVLQMRKDVELHVFAWECRTKRDEQFRVWLSAQNPAQLAGAEYDI
jgi:hypothetical protein